MSGSSWVCILFHDLHVRGTDSRLGPASGAIIAFCFGISLVVYLVTKKQLDAKQKEEEKRLQDLERNVPTEKGIQKVDVRHGHLESSSVGSNAARIEG
jgi:hypothetical protein